MICVKLLLIFFAFVYFDCGSVKNTGMANQTAAQKIPDDLLITLDRTHCFGICPVYKLSVKADGAVTFEGLDFTKVKGKADGKISAEKLNLLIKAFENAGYFNLNGKYDALNCYQWTDAPSATTSIQINGKSKSISHYQGCKEGTKDFEEELSKLTDLENKIDEIVETKNWIGEGK